MILQILGVALISLLTITPTIQQNNIEQLIAPNIEIQPMTMTSPNANRLLVVNQFSYYAYNGSLSTASTFVSSQLYSQFTQYFSEGQDRTFQIDANESTTYNVHIVDDNFFVSTLEWNLQGSVLRNVLREYYLRERGAYPTSESFSFNTTNVFLSGVQNYTYTMGGTQGNLNGNIRITTWSNIQPITGNKSTSNITLPVNSSLATVINALNPTIVNNTNNENIKILYYFLNQEINLSQTGTVNRQLYARTNFGRVLDYGSFNLTLEQADTTPPVIQGPTSLTFEVGTYQLIEQILNIFYTITDQPNDDWDWNILGDYNLSQVGIYNISIRAFDTANNETIYPIQLNITAPPQNDTTPPVITGSGTILINLGQINNDLQLINTYFQIIDDITLPSAISKVLTGTRSYTQSGTYNLTLTATDQANNSSTFQFIFIINTPLIDNEPPVIISDLIVSITIGDFTDRQEILDFYTLVTDNIALSSVLLVGDINFNVVGDYQLQIIATDTSQNQATRNILIRIKDEIILGNYNPLTDLLSGIFGGLLSMIFTIGTINILGLRLLDAMGVIILGAVLLFIYKAIKGGS